MRRIAVSALLLGSLACLATTAHAQWAPLPPPRYEVAPPPPPGGPRMLWQKGAWEWDGHGYVWRPGHYVAWRPRHHHWVPGHWARRGYGPVWIPAHWR